MAKRKTVLGIPKCGHATSCGSSSAPDCSPIPDSVIIDIQKRAYERKDTVLAFTKTVEEGRRNQDKIERELTALWRELREYADFLQKYNADAQEDGTWHEALGIGVNTELTLAARNAGKKGNEI